MQDLGLLHPENKTLFERFMEGRSNDTDYKWEQLEKSLNDNFFDVSEDDEEFY